MNIGNLNLSSSIILAPLAGVSSPPFRILAISGGAGMSFTEMVSSEGIIRDQGVTRSMMEFGPQEQPIGIQIFGANPEVMGRSAEIIAEQYKPDLIDINFGCPVKKVVNKNGGAAALKDLVLAEEIMQAVVEGAGKIPVSIKIRIGWDDHSPVHLEVSQMAEKAGVVAVTLHARTRAKGYSGSADWSAIKDLKEAVGITVIGNGDVRTPLDAERMLNETGCDGVMIGRAALGNPFIFGQINEYLKTGQLPDDPTIRERLQTARRHAELVVSYNGEERGAKIMRRYLGWYVRGMPSASVFRPKLFKVTTLNEINLVLDQYLSEHA